VFGQHAEEIMFGGKHPQQQRLRWLRDMLHLFP